MRAFVEMARAADGRDERGARLRADVGEYLLGRAVDHGCPLVARRAPQALAHDVELNAQGLEVWLDRAKG